MHVLAGLAAVRGEEVGALERAIDLNATRAFGAALPR
jgi:hypothetical protein